MHGAHRPRGDGPCPVPAMPNLQTQGLRWARRDRVARPRPDRTRPADICGLALCATPPCWRQTGRRTALATDAGRVHAVHLEAQRPEQATRGNLRVDLAVCSPVLHLHDVAWLIRTGTWACSRSVASWERRTGTSVPGQSSEPTEAAAPPGGRATACRSTATPCPSQDGVPLADARGSSSVCGPSGRRCPAAAHTAPWRRPRNQRDAEDRHPRYRFIDPLPPGQGVDQPDAHADGECRAHSLEVLSRQSADAGLFSSEQVRCEAAARQS